MKRPNFNLSFNDKSESIALNPSLKSIGFTLRVLFQKVKITLKMANTRWNMRLKIQITPSSSGCDGRLNTRLL